MGVKQRMSVKEYLALPEEKPYLEYVNGEVYPKVAPDRKHSDIADYVLGTLWDYRKEHGGRSAVEGRVAFLYEDDERFYLPDVAYYAPGRPRGEGIMYPPTLAVEIKSKDQPLRDLRDKCRFYRQHGVDVCWLIDPHRRFAEVFEGEVNGLRLDEDGVLESRAVPGYRLPLRDLFATLDTDL